MTRPGFSAALLGGESLLVQCGDVLRERGHDIRLVATADPAVRQWAGAHGIPLVEPGDPEFARRLHEAGVDVLFSIANLARVPAEALSAVGLAVNFHDGPLPRFAGLNAPAWALMARAADYGITWHVMTAAIDAGDILAEARFPVAPDETALTLNLKCYQAALDTFGTLVHHLERGDIDPRPQAAEPRTMFARDARPPAAALLAFDAPAEETAALVRALDFGAYRNPLALPKLLAREGVLIVGRAVPGHERSSLPPGTVVTVDRDGIVVATSTTDLRLSGFRSLEGDPVDVVEAAARLDAVAGARLRDLDADARERLTRLNEQAARAEAFWIDRLRHSEPASLPLLTAGPAEEPREGDWVTCRGTVPPGLVPAAADASGAQLSERLAAAFAVFVARSSGQWDVRLAWSDAARHPVDDRLRPFFARAVPAIFDPAPEERVADWLDRAHAEFQRLDRQPHASDLAARHPHVAAAADTWRLGVMRSPAGDTEPSAHDLVLRVTDAEPAWSLCWRPGVLTSEAGAALARQFTCLLEAMAAGPAGTLGSLPLVSAGEHARLVQAWNQTDRPVTDDRAIHDIIAAQAARTPAATAVIFRDASLSYRELDEHANRLARRLQGLGVGPDVPVGICLDRSIDLVVSMLAVLKAGGAYVPIDPAYPAERVQLVLADADPAVLITERAVLPRLGDTRPALIVVDRDRAVIAGESPAPVECAADASHLAYLIYTSGSTGQPKGVMVEHRNVVNFFTAMDDRIGTEPGVWLAVTSLSFDISVLELLWTLARGFTVVLCDDEARVGVRRDPETVRSRRPADFSLFYFAADAGDQSANTYQLLLEGARFADTHGFAAVWTPERHFHDFGGLYPNPSVIAAALAMVTERVQIRAGSVVLPLHHPARVAEEWAVVDNLSGGRVAVSFASGWQPNDFVLRPETFQDSKGALARDLEIVRRLWRGDAVTFPGPKGDVEVRTLPRPVQPELPVWLTSAGNPETFAAAGSARAFILTHLLGQSVGELRRKIDAYRQAWRRAGHAGEGYVTLMLHTFVGENDDDVRETVRGPLMAYLRSAAGLMRQYASTFPAFRRRLDGGADADAAFKSLSPAELDDLLAFAADRYYETSGLMGSRDKCLEMLAELRAAGVDEVACLIDFGVPASTVLRHLDQLAALKDAADRASDTMADAGLSYAAGALIRRHGVTHVQCTPSQARIWLADSEARAALGRVRCLLVGGEALPAALARELATVAGGRIINMYGPTETTVWSCTQAVVDVQADGTTVPIGRPIANTQCYVLDAQRMLVPEGLPGELYLGGAGVARGYFRRPELTAERFVDDPFRGGRLYRTGDVVRYRADGVLEFLGRVDHQVKIRGHRIELGEIEACLLSDDRVSESVVVARDDAGADARLVAYVAPRAAMSAAERTALGSALKGALGSRLPAVMRPAQVVVIERLPRTPNGKIDRRALPAPVSAAPARAAGAAAPESDIERRIAGIWSEILGVADVGLRDNFFDLGGDSLLAVQAHRRLRDAMARDLSLTDLFRFPTVRALAEHLSPSGPDAQVVDSRARADRRRELMRRRHAG